MYLLYFFVQMHIQGYCKSIIKLLGEYLTSATKYVRYVIIRYKQLSEIFIYQINNAEG